MKKIATRISGSLDYMSADILRKYFYYVNYYQTSDILYDACVPFDNLMWLHITALELDHDTDIYRIL